MKMFLDDIRIPTNAEKEKWLIFKSYKLEVQFCMVIICPDNISFDHDLG